MPKALEREVSFGLEAACIRMHVGKISCQGDHESVVSRELMMWKHEGDAEFLHEGFKGFSYICICDHAAADEDHPRRPVGSIQHLVRGDHQLRALDRQRPRLRPGGDDDVLAFEPLAVDADGERVNASR